MLPRWPPPSLKSFAGFSQGLGDQNTSRSIFATRLSGSPGLLRNQKSVSVPILPRAGWRRRQDYVIQINIGDVFEPDGRSRVGRVHREDDIARAERLRVASVEAVQRQPPEHRRLRVRRLTFLWLERGVSGGATTHVPRFGCRSWSDPRWDARECRRRESLDLTTRPTRRRC